MASSSPLNGAVLVDCARANIQTGIDVAAHQCGYGKDTSAFKSALKSACDEMNIDLQEFASFAVENPVQAAEGMNVSPDSDANL
jgi:pyruvate-formate lyase-activating enzyme